jgi:N-acetylglucosamine-6-phosphate deacetylase
MLNQNFSKIIANNYKDSLVISLEIKDGIFENVSQISNSHNEDLPFIAPGLLDNQVNGYGGIDFSADDLKVEQVNVVVEGMHKSGVTTFLPTLITNSFDLLHKNFAVLTKSREDPFIAQSVPGFHLEGPYISSEDGYRGAHDLRFVRNPNWEEFEKLQKVAKGLILQVTLAPELDGALPFIKQCRKNNIVVSLAHFNASNDQLLAAVDAGAQTSTHLGNGCANLIHRRENILWPQLAEDRLISTIICDGFHLTPEMVKTFIRAKTPDRIIATSDITLFAGMPQGEHKIKGHTFLLKPNGHASLPSQNVLAGSALPLDIGVENILKFTDCSLGEAIQMTSTNPARLYGFSQLGELKPGNSADYILFKIQKNSLIVQQTIVNGVCVYSGG